MPQSAYAPKKKPLIRKRSITAKKKATPVVSADKTTPTKLEMMQYENSYNEIVANYNHYVGQSERYELLHFGGRLFIFLASLAAAILLAIKSGNVARKVAIVLTLLVSGAQGADEAFNISPMHQISYRTALNLSRLLRDYEIEVDSAKSQPAVDDAISKYHKKYQEIIDKEIDIWLGNVGALEVDINKGN